MNGKAFKVGDPVDARSVRLTSLEKLFSDHYVKLTARQDYIVTGG